MILERGGVETPTPGPAWRFDSAYRDRRKPHWLEVMTISTSSRHARRRDAYRDTTVIQSNLRGTANLISRRPPYCGPSSTLLGERKRGLGSSCGWCKP